MNSFFVLGTSVFISGMCGRRSFARATVAVSRYSVGAVQNSVACVSVYAIVEMLIEGAGNACTGLFAYKSAVVCRTANAGGSNGGGIAPGEAGPGSGAVINGTGATGGEGDV